MPKELELAKKLMVLGWIYHNQLITDTEYISTKKRIMQDYGIISFLKTD